MTKLEALKLETDRTYLEFVGGWDAKRQMIDPAKEQAYRRAVAAYMAELKKDPAALKAYYDSLGLASLLANTSTSMASPVKQIHAEAEAETRLRHA